MLSRASKFDTAKIERRFEMSKPTPFGVTFILLAMVHVHEIRRLFSLFRMLPYCMLPQQLDPLQCH